MGSRAEASRHRTQIDDLRCKDVDNKLQQAYRFDRQVRCFSGNVNSAIFLSRSIANTMPVGHTSKNCGSCRRSPESCDRTADNH